MYVYAEEVFIVNFIMDMLIAAFVMRHYGRKKYILRTIICGFIGGIYAITVLYIPSGILSKFAVSLIMGCVICGRSIYDCFMSAIMLLFGSLLCSGGIILTDLLLQDIHITAGKNILTMLSGSFCGLFIFNMTVKTIKKTEGLKGLTFSSEIIFAERKIQAKLLQDSGNLLKTINGENIIMISEDMFYRLCPELKEYAATALPEIYDGRISFVMAGSVTGEKLFTVLKADTITLREQNINLSPAYISPAKIKDVRFDGIINLNTKNSGGENA